MAVSRKPRSPALEKSRKKGPKLTEPKRPRLKAVDTFSVMTSDPRQQTLPVLDNDLPAEEGRRCGAEWGLLFEGDPQPETDLVKNYVATFEKGGDFLARMEWRGYVRKEEAQRQCKRLREIVRTPTHLYLIEERRMIEAWVFADGTWKLCAEKTDDGTFADYGTHPETP